MEEEDDLEYHVTMPSPLYASSHHIRASSVDAEDSRRRSSVVKPEALVIILGWAGCLDRYLAKYSRIYEQKGCITLRYTLPAQNIFFYPERVNIIAEKLIGVFHEMVFDEHPIIFHSFSNGGIFLYKALTYYVHENPDKFPNKLDIRGAIFDSGPGMPTFRGLFLALYENSTGGWLVRALKSIFYTVVIILKDIATKLKLLFTQDSQHSRRSYWEGIKYEPGRWPQLYLYSSTDIICRPQHVEEVIDARKGLGIDVYTKKFADSAHCRHFLRYEEEYEKSICDFLDAIV